MLAKEIHNGLDKQEIRDFLGVEVGECWDASNPEFYKEEITRLEKKLERAKKKEALIALMNHLGWKDFDVSEFYTLEVGENWVQFIGTQEDFDEFLKQTEYQNNYDAV